MKKFFLLLIAVLTASCFGPKDGEYTLHLLTTNDVHGRYFDSTYVSEATHASLQNVSWYADSLRSAVGKENVILIDAGGFTERAIFGELMASYCKVRGVRGIVCDGAVRARRGHDLHRAAAGQVMTEQRKEGRR